MHDIFYSYFDDDDLLRITNKITEKEKVTQGEIVISIKEKRSFFQDFFSLENLAKKEFLRLGINKTNEGTGILFYLILQSKELQILADSPINEKVNQNTWTELKDEILAHFKNGKYCEGLILAVDKAGDILAKYFPKTPDNQNEISNRVIIRS